MNINLRKKWRWLFLAVCSLLSAPVWAGITGSAQPTSISIPLAQPTSIVLTWTVTTSSAPGTSFTMSSASGQFVTPLGQPLGTINTVVSRVITGPVNVAVTAIITEAVSVPLDVSVLALKLGVSSIYYQRTFTDGASSESINANISIGGSGAANFGVTRLALEFDDGAVVRVVPLKSQLSAVANVNYNGSGMFIGYWEVADPGSTFGTPIFSQMQAVFQGLGGDESVKFASQNLPTENQGLYKVRLHVTNPLPGFEPPVLYYYVGEPKVGSAFSFMPMTILNPPNQSYVDPVTQFVWQPVTGAGAYKIEIFANPDAGSSNLPEIGGANSDLDPQQVRSALSRPPMAGMLVGGNQTRTMLSPSTRAKLIRHGSYYWRIQAIGTDGSTIGEAEVREIRIP